MKIRYDSNEVSVHCTDGRAGRYFKTMRGAMATAERFVAKSPDMIVMVFPGVRSPLLHATVRPGVTEVLFRSNVEEAT